jgi:hypothetical protein
LIQTPPRGVSQLPLTQSRGRVERINVREALPAYLQASSREVLVLHMGKSRPKPNLKDQAETETPIKVLPPPIPIKGISWILLILGIIGSLHVLVMLGIEFNRTLEMRQNITRISGDVTALESEVSELKAVIQHSDDQNYREQLAREQGFAFPKEMRFITLPNE